MCDINMLIDRLVYDAKALALAEREAELEGKAGSLITTRLCIRNSMSDIEKFVNNIENYFNEEIKSLNKALEDYKNFTVECARCGKILDKCYETGCHNAEGVYVTTYGISPCDCLRENDSVENYLFKINKNLERIAKALEGKDINE